jgi:hypothetical protein
VLKKTLLVWKVKVFRADGVIPVTWFDRMVVGVSEKVKVEFGVNCGEKICVSLEFARCS